ncbi:MAG: hypothetical protein WCM76_13855 [Bacteroidota bacterium]
MHFTHEISQSPSAQWEVTSVLWELASVLWELASVLWEPASVSGKLTN